MGLYFKSIWMFMKCELEYKTSFILSMIASAFSSFFSFVGVVILIDKFGGIDGWNLNELMLLLGIACFGHVITEMFGRGLDHFYKEVKRGLLDQILVRPRNITFQVLCSNFQTSKIGRLLEYTIILIYAIFKVDIEWSLYKVFVLAFMILGSMILFFSILLLKASFSFWTIEGMEAMNIISDGGRDVASYPISIYKKWFAFIFTYIIPFGCVNYYPALYFLDKAGAKAWYGFLPFATLIFLFFAFKIWNFGLKSYKSTGS